MRNSPPADVTFPHDNHRTRLMQRDHGPAGKAGFFQGRHGDRGRKRMNQILA